MFIMGERERKREREREGERERERERRREYLAGSYYYNEMRIALHTCLPDNFLVCWPPVSALSVFHGNLPQEIWGTYFPHRESTSWNFPAKIWNSLRLIPSFDMVSKFPGSDHSSRRRYVAKLLAERINNKNNKNKEISRSGSRFRSNISKTVRDIRVPFSLLARCKSHATKWCNPRLCSCYRFWDILVANTNNFPILLEQTRICRRTSSHGIMKGLVIRSEWGELVEFKYEKINNNNNCMISKIAKIWVQCITALL